MKQKFVSKIPLLCSVFFGLIFFFWSCRDKEEEVTYWKESVVGTADISGRVTDNFGTPLDAVTVDCLGTGLKKEVFASATTKADGTFFISAVPSTARYIRFTKEGYASASCTLEPKRFAEESSISLEASLEFSMAKITGTILDAGSGKPMSGVLVASGLSSSRTGDDGVYSIEGLTISNYDLTFTSPDGSRYSRSVNASEFVDGVIMMPIVRLGGEDIWPGHKWQEIADAPYWYGNDFRGSTGFSGRWDWSAGYMSAWPWYGEFRYEAEGCAVVCNTNYGQPGETDHFNGYTYGKKFIYEGNHIMTVDLMTHFATTPETALHFGVEVLDLTAQATKAVKVGEDTHYGDYAAHSFDLSAFIGHEIVIAYGLYWYDGTNGHLATRRVSFANRPMNKDEVIPGTKFEGMEAWDSFTKENILTMTINNNTSFSGLNFGQNAGTEENGVRRVHHPGEQQGYSAFAGTNHIIMNWTLQYVRGGVEPVNPDGYTIKSAGDGSARYDNPDTYLVNRFHIGPTNDRMRILVRSYHKTYRTVFRVTAVTDDGTAVAVDPASYKADKTGPVDNGKGCWYLVHNRGTGNPAEYAEFVYDLNKYQGQNVAIAISVHRADMGGEGKLCIYSIEMD